MIIDISRLQSPRNFNKLRQYFQESDTEPQQESESDPELDLGLEPEPEYNNGVELRQHEHAYEQEATQAQELEQLYEQTELFPMNTVIFSHLSVIVLKHLCWKMRQRCSATFLNLNLLRTGLQPFV